MQHERRQTTASPPGLGKPSIVRRRGRRSGRSMLRRRFDQTVLHGELLPGTAARPAQTSESFVAASFKPFMYLACLATTKGRQ